VKRLRRIVGLQASAPLPLSREGDLERSIGEGNELLWTAVARRGVPARLERLLLSSTRHGEGTSTVAWRVALGLAQHLGARVTLVEVATTGAPLSRRLGLPGTPGFCDLLSGAAQPSEVICRPANADLLLVPAGATSPGTGDLVSPRGRELLTRLGLERHFLIFDAPPLLLDPAARPLLTCVDQAVLIARAGQTCIEEALHWKREVEHSGIPILGSILNQATP
jgi:Mrp family chromosome partitioning ATPase